MANPAPHAGVPGAYPGPEPLRTRKVESVYVYEWPVRIWHWVNALCIVVLGVTGYFIGSPPPSVPGEASASFLFGYIRFAHFAAAWVFGMGFVGRLYWAAVGNIHARQLFAPPVLNAKWWAEVWHEVRWYAFLEKAPRSYEGHNPLAQIMFFLVGLIVAFMTLSGGALYSEGAGAGSLSDTLFGWIIPFLGGSQAVHTYHHLGLWAFICFLCIHLYAACRDDIMSRQSVISSMISGWREFERD